MKVIAVIPFVAGKWKETDNYQWTGLHFLEVVLDWTLFKGCKGKLYVETMHNDEEYGGMIRLAYQQYKALWMPVDGSEIITKQPHEDVNWALLESEWFKLPTYVAGVACLWIQGKADGFKKCRVALATLVITEE